MQPLNAKRARLQDELQQAYDAWMDESELAARDSAPAGPVDVSGSPNGATPLWLAYLAAKQRLVRAYAEQQSRAA